MGRFLIPPCGIRNDIVREEELGNEAGRFESCSVLQENSGKTPCLIPLNPKLESCHPDAKRRDLHLPDISCSLIAPSGRDDSLRSGGISITRYNVPFNRSLWKG